MIQLIISGVATGCIYALVALGFVLIYNAVNTVNFAQGDLVMVGAYLAMGLVTMLKVPAWLGYLLVITSMAIFGVVFERIAYHPLRDKPLVTVIISTLGVGIVLRNAALVGFGPLPLNLAPALGVTPVHLFGAEVQPQNIFIVAVTLALIVFQYFFFNRTSLGVQMMATAQDRDAARLVGVKVNRMVAITFAWATVLAGIAGLLLAPIFFVTTDMGTVVILKAFAASIVGGFGSLGGAIVGGIFLGLVEAFGATYVSSAYTDGFSFIVLIAVLLLLPRGFFGERTAEKV